MKKFMMAAAIAATMAMPSAASAQVYVPVGENEGACVLDIFSNISPTKCAGFFGANSNSGDPGSALSADMVTAMGLFGLPTNGTILAKAEYKNGDGNFSGFTFYGISVIGYHWGNYPDAPANEIGNVSAFYVFDAGAGGVSNLGLERLGGLSNGVVLYTGTGGGGGECTRPGGCIEVPEPSNFALVGAGLLALGLVARRRRQA